MLPQVLRFISAGGVGVLLYYLILYTLTDLVGFWYISSAIIASVVNFLSNFILHKLWTFKNRDFRTIRRQVGLFASMGVVLFVINVVLLYILVEYARLWYLAAQVIVTMIITVIAFLGTRRIFAS